MIWLLMLIVVESGNGHAVSFYTLLISAALKACRCFEHVHSLEVLIMSCPWSWQSKCDAVYDYKSLLLHSISRVCTLLYVFQPQTPLPVKSLWSLFTYRDATWLRHTGSLEDLVSDMSKSRPIRRKDLFVPNLIGRPGDWFFSLSMLS